MSQCHKHIKYSLPYYYIIDSQEYVVLGFELMFRFDIAVSPVSQPHQSKMNGKKEETSFLTVSSSDSMEMLEELRR